MKRIPQLAALAIVCLLQLPGMADEPKPEILIPRDRAGHTAVDEATEPFTCVAISGDGKWVAAGTVYGSVFLWDATTGKLVQEFPDHETSISALALSTDGKRLLSGSEEGAVIQWETNPPRRVRILRNDDFRITTLFFSINGKKMLTGSTRGPVTLWDAETGRRLTSLSGAPNAFFAGMSSDASRAVTVDHESVALWDLTSGRRLNSQDLPPNTFREVRYHLPVDAHFSCDGKLVVIRGLRSRMTTWETTAGKKLEKGKWQEETHINVADNYDRPWVNAIGYAAYVWDDGRGKRSRLPWIPDNTADPRIAISEDGENAAVIGTKRHVALQRGGDRVELRAPDKRLARLSSDWLASVSFGSDGKRFIVSTVEGVVWNAATGTARRTTESTSIEPNLTSFSEKRQRMASVDAENSAVVRDRKPGAILRTFAYHKQRISALALNADGNQVFVGCRDHTGDLWDVDSGKRIQTFSGPAASPTASISPDGKRLLTDCSDDTARLWDVSSGKELVRFYSFNSGQDWLAMTPEEYFDGSDGARKLLRLRVGGRLDPEPPSRLDKYYRPGLVELILKGERVK